MKKLLAFLILLLAPLVEAQVVINPGGGGSATAAGSNISGCTAYSIVTIDSTGALVCNPASVVNGSVSTAGRGIVTISDVLSGSSATSNLLNITGTFPATLSAETSGALFSFTADNDTQPQNGLSVALVGSGHLQRLSGIRAVLTGTGGGNFYSAAGDFRNNTTSSSAGPTPAIGLIGVGPAANAVNNTSFGISGYSDIVNNTALKVQGVTGFTTGVSGVAAAQAIGVAGVADNDATIAAGGWFGATAVGNQVDGVYPVTTTGKSALVADNVATTWNIFEARDNGTAVFTIADGGIITGIGNAMFGTTSLGMYSYTGSGQQNLSLFSSSTPALTFGTFYNAPDVQLQREAAATLQMGADVNGAPVAQTFKAHDGITGTDKIGANLTLASGNGTGAGAGSQLNLNAPIALATGTTAQTSQNRVTVCETKILSNTTATTTTLATIGAASNTLGGGEVHISIMANNGTTDFAGETQSATFSWTNKAGTFTTSTPTITASSASASAGAGSATIGFTLTGAASLISLKVTPVFTTIAPTLVTAYIEVINHGPGAVTCQ